MLPLVSRLGTFMMRGGLIVTLKARADEKAELVSN